MRLRHRTIGEQYERFGKDSMTTTNPKQIHCEEGPITGDYSGSSFLLGGEYITSWEVGITWLCECLTKEEQEEATRLWKEWEEQMIAECQASGG